MSIYEEKEQICVRKGKGKEERKGREERKRGKEERKGRGKGMCGRGRLFEQIGIDKVSLGVSLFFPLARTKHCKTASDSAVNMMRT